jgi:hypothetical protein|tara:strand:- start:22 stop:258 length:237 start_codon:yes stop_codon:yes gene_type:complete
MERVQITVYGINMMVDQDMVKKMLKKEALVKEMQKLSAMIKAEPSATVQMFLEMQARKANSSIIGLNRTIRRTAQVIQ